MTPEREPTRASPGSAARQVAASPGAIPTLHDHAAALVELADRLEQELAAAAPHVAEHLEAVANLPQDAGHSQAWFDLCAANGFEAFVVAVARMSNLSLRASLEMPRPLYERRKARGQAPLFRS